MTTFSNKAKQLIKLYSSGKPFDQVLKDIALKEPDVSPPPPDLPGTLSWNEEARKKRIQFLQQNLNTSLAYLSGKEKLPEADFYKGNIENFIGLTQVPTGLVGPLFINGTLAQGDFYVPMATTEGALIASYNRGAKATRLSGGITSVCTTEGLQRAPIWKFNSLSEVGAFVFWLLQELDKLKEIVTQHSKYAVLEELKINMEGNQVLTVFEYTCGEAAGQNMVTICTEEVCQYILQHTPVKPLFWFIESNYSGDKKATAVSFTSVRGKKVTAEALIKKSVVKEALHTTPETISVYWQASVVGASQSGSIGIQGHFANGLAALFLACGQDVACIAEAHIGITRMEVMGDDLYVAITLPALVVGTVGGGTHLPTQNECLQLLDCKGKNSARKFAEICGAVALSGELSIAAALASGQFSKAHKIFRRKNT
jgi:hydroxymethylglutaryl-CoA reductase (NADPH)